METILEAWKNKLKKSQMNGKNKLDDGKKKNDKKSRILEEKLKNHVAQKIKNLEAEINAIKQVVGGWRDK